jgi:hypothetical protein
VSGSGSLLNEAGEFGGLKVILAENRYIYEMAGTSRVSVVLA